jgi:hypothetical protein
MGLKVYVCFSSLQQWLWSASFEEREGSIGFRQKGVLHSKRMRVCEVRSPQSRGNVPPASALTVVCPVLVRLLKNRSINLRREPIHPIEKEKTTSSTAKTHHRNKESCEGNLRDETAAETYSLPWKE